MKHIHSYQLDTFPLFKSVNEPIKSKLVENLHFFECNTDDILYDYEEEAIDCFFVFDGAVKQQNHTRDGKYIHLSYHTAGDYFGYYPAFEKTKRVCRAICSEPSIIATLDNKNFVDIFLENRILSLDLIQKLVSFSNEQILMRSGKQVLSAHEHIILDLLRRSEKLGSNHIALPPRKEWAAYLGIAPETLSREITHFKKSGTIKLIGDDIKILDRCALKTRLSGE